MSISIINCGWLLISAHCGNGNELRRWTFWRGWHRGQEQCRGSRLHWFLRLFAVVTKPMFAVATVRDWHWRTSPDPRACTRVRVCVRRACVRQPRAWCVRRWYIGRLRHLRYSCSKPIPDTYPEKPLSLGTCAQELKNTLIASFPPPREWPRRCPVDRVEIAAFRPDTFMSSF